METIQQFPVGSLEDTLLEGIVKYLLGGYQGNAEKVYWMTGVKVDGRSRVEVDLGQFFKFVEDVRQNALYVGKQPTVPYYTPCCFKDRGN